MYIVIDSDHYPAYGIRTMFFPGGEPHIKLLPLFTGANVLFFLKPRTWSDTGFGACVLDALCRSDANKITAFIPYFPAARQDKPTGEAPLTLALMARLFSQGRHSVVTFDEHSLVMQQQLGRHECLMPRHLQIPVRRDVVGVIAPDEGATARATDFRDAFYPGRALIQCFKKRDPRTGTLSAMSGAGHLLSFTGTDTIPAIKLLHDCYGGEGLIGGSVPATEHMVMCLGGKEDERETFHRLMRLYPNGIVSVVSDTWDLWKVITETLPSLKSQIMGRDGKLVIRPDSGDPVLIITGDATQPPGTPAHKGVIELLWDLFGGTVNKAGYRELDSHIGAIYGDSITEERARQICERLKAKGFASTNIVLGIGSFTYQYCTRDTHGFAVKATWARVNGEERFLFKDPITDNGTKKSARGRLLVVEEGGALRLIDGLTLEQQDDHAGNLLQPVWRDGRFLKRQTLAEIRARVRS